MKPRQSLIELLKTDYKNVELTYVGELFGKFYPKGRITERGAEWAIDLDYRIGEALISRKLGTLIYHPNKLEPIWDGFYLDNDGKEIWYYQKHNNNRIKEFEVK